MAAAGGHDAPIQPGGLIPIMQQPGNLPTVTVNVFPGGFNWGVYVGQDKGFFADAGIAVEVQDTPNSVTQMTDFSLGRFDIAMTAVDNIVAYVEGQGEAPIGRYTLSHGR